MEKRSRWSKWSPAYRHGRPWVKTGVDLTTQPSAKVNVWSEQDATQHWSPGSPGLRHLRKKRHLFGCKLSIFSWPGNQLGDREGRGPNVPNWTFPKVSTVNYRFATGVHRITRRGAASTRTKTNAWNPLLRGCPDQQTDTPHGVCAG